MTVPSDIRDYVRKKYTKQIVMCVATEILLITYLLLFGKRTFSAFDTFSYVLIHVLLIVAPIAGFGIHTILRDRSWRGTVTRVMVYTATDNDYPYKNTTAGMHFKNHIYVFVEDEAGNVSRRKVYAGKAREGRFINTYQPGDVVTHVAGTGFVQIKPKRAADPVICVVCGAESTADSGICRACGHTLIIE
ncbi:MAG: hypothetical protein J6D21_00450 [Clostridia bacterium]|nr:hypothetical protein [Clostridia bacterium]